MSNTTSSTEQNTSESETTQEIPRFQLYTEADLEKLPPIEYLIEGILPRNSLTGIFGPSNIGKSFIALDMACSIARGLPFLGHAVKQGSVIYIAAEGVIGIRKRVRAWREAKEIQEFIAGLYFVRVPVQLLQIEEMSELCGIIAKHFGSHNPVLVIFDTLARCMVGGDENSTAHMGYVIEHADQMRRMTGATVLLVHHSGRRGDHERGSTAFRAGLDVLLRANNSKGQLTLSCDKAKDFLQFDDMTLTLVPQGESCVIKLKSSSGGSEWDTLPESSKKMLLSLHIFATSGASNGDWQRATTISASSFQQKIPSLRDAGYVQSDSSGKGSRYSLTERGRVLVSPHCNVTLLATTSSNPLNPLVHSFPSLEGEGGVVTEVVTGSHQPSVEGEGQ